MQRVTNALAGTGTWARRLLIAYSAILFFNGIGLAKYDIYQLDGDALAFMDIASAMLRHDWAMAINGYWNPLYSVVLAAGLQLAHPTRVHELQVFYYCNFFIYCCSFAACAYLISGLLQLRAKKDPDATHAFSATALYFFSFATLLVSFLRELSLGKVRSDALMMTLFFVAAGTLLRIQVERRVWLFPLLGLSLGLAYLTKSYAMIPSVLLLGALGLYAVLRERRMLAGVILAGLVYAALAGPYVYGISKQRGYLTTGESARMNYAFFVDGTARWHEWRTGDLGHASANWAHHEELLLNSPAIYSYRDHQVGTYPLWFDPSYWTQGLKPKIYLMGHVHRLIRTTELLTRFLLERPEPLVVLLLFFLLGARLPASWREALPYLVLIGWGALLVAIYMPIDLQDRYVQFAFMFVLFPLTAMLRTGRSAALPAGVEVACIALAFVLLGQSLRDIAQTRRIDNVTAQPGGAYSKQIYPAAAALRALGTSPGSYVACFGDQACYVDQYWARLADTAIDTEIEVPDDGDPMTFWNSLTNKEQVLATVRRNGAKAIVAESATTTDTPAGWEHVPGTVFFVYPLNQ
ncbi:hypothetical protein SAMN05421819_1949 [Bryocella elongata]|uniref:Dolichyl-phosphate-mannose-protein mannosyltransferase n=1 Tax=Bryocella elongata TaxID=863522 RepID=A0A1H5XSA2_9BACT|nr:hypothetical protein [Bryocella elongata]SEG14624.1 hypothetical protein SAMN05421819_1949 [Bryocella elongata]